MTITLGDLKKLPEEHIRILQQSLKDGGGDIKVDGIAGSKTLDAIVSRIENASEADTTIMQQSLQEKGYDIKVDGIAGFETLTASLQDIADSVKGSENIPQYSVDTPDVDQAPVKQPPIMVIECDVSDVGEVKEFRQEETVKTIQEQLNKSGFNAGSVDGMFGNGTSRALKGYIKELQEQNQLPATGEYGEAIEVVMRQEGHHEMADALNEMKNNNLDNGHSALDTVYHPEVDTTDHGCAGSIRAVESNPTVTYSTPGLG